MRPNRALSTLRSIRSVLDELMAEPVAVDLLSDPGYLDGASGL